MTAEAAAALIWCPFPDAGAARKAAETLLDERLVACANMLGAMQSLYVWNGERGEAEETGVLFKTEATLVERAIERLGAIHPYDEPAIVAWPCDAAGAGTLRWLGGLRA